MDIRHVYKDNKDNLIFKRNLRHARSLKSKFGDDKSLPISGLSWLEKELKKKKLLDQFIKPNGFNKKLEMMKRNGPAGVNTRSFS